MTPDSGKSLLIGALFIAFVVTIINLAQTKIAPKPVPFYPVLIQKLKNGGRVPFPSIR